MDKNSIRKYAVWARRELIERVSQRAMIYGVTDNDTGDFDADTVNNRLLSATEKGQRQALIKNVKAKGYSQVVEEVAYTWFNRFVALRFMEVNGYLPSHVRVFTNDAGEFKPEILTEAINLELDGLDSNKVFELLNDNKNEELFKYLLIVQCNALNKILPAMFQRIEDYTGLLLPDYLLREGSVIEQMVTMIPEDDWKDQVQIIGWLYQYYNSELKDKIFADLKKNIKISKKNIPAATQLFTPDWIVHYMVENSLGRLWLEGHPDDNLKSEWKYYLDEAPQEDDVQIQLSAIRQQLAELKPEDIRVVDPCMGSGHILCVLFDVLIQIYQAYGYTAREAAIKIVENNLWGLDIDERAAQLAYFAVMMKARQYDRRFFTRNAKPHVFAIRETNNLRAEYDTFVKNRFNLTKEQQATLDYLIDAFNDAKEYGSIIQLADYDYRDLETAWAKVQNNVGGLWSKVMPQIDHLIQQAIALTQKYHVVATNPPYMGSSGMSAKLAAYVKENFPDSKSDLFAVFIERGFQMLKANGYESMITMESWMFLSSFEKLRTNLVQSKTIKTLVHMPYLGRGGTSLGINFGTDMAVVQNRCVKNYIGTYDRIAYYETDNDGVPFEFPFKNEFYKQITQNNFSKIPGAPIAYWVSKPYREAFANGKFLGNIADSKQGLATADNNRFLRLWHEVQITSIKFNAKSAAEALESKKKWFPYNKGGEFRKWYGNNDYVVNWENDGFEIKHNFDAKKNLRSRPQNTQYYFKECASWSLVTSGIAAFRYKPFGYIFDVAGMSFFSSDLLLYLLALCNTKVAMNILSVVAPTINFQCGDIANIPVFLDANIKPRVEELAKENISLSRADWDAFETSWDFKEHPFSRCARSAGGSSVTIKKVFDIWQTEAEDRFNKLKTNEEELNRIFIDIYKLGDELTPDVEDKDVTVRRADFQREVRSFLSYAVGCMFGRYSLDTAGLIYAGGDWEPTKYQTFKPNKHEIIPISDAEYFETDIISRLIEFLTAAFGQETLEENLRQIAEAVGRRSTPREAIRSYFINDFYSEHVKTYQKRPIYWLFDSGKKNGFKCLIYMHRYRPDTVARIRTDYVHEQQARYWTAIEDLEKRIDGASTTERVKLTKQLAALKGQAEEIRAYEEKIHHLADCMTKIDLDDGVKHNYELFKDVLAKIK